VIKSEKILHRTKGIAFASPSNAKVSKDEDPIDQFIEWQDHVTNPVIFLAGIFIRFSRDDMPIASAIAGVSQTDCAGDDVAGTDIRILGV
jgi:hypothetical protein